MGVTFYSDALAANSSKPDSENVRIMIMAKVLVGTCVKRAEEGASESSIQTVSINNKTGLPIDTYTDSSQTMFFKFQMSEVYPEFLLVYRDTSSGPDTRSSQLKLRFSTISYRTGTRFNPQELQNDDEKENMDNIERAGVFAHETIINVKENDRQEVVSSQPTSKVVKASAKKKSFFRWRSVEEKSEEKSIELKQHLMSK